MIETTLAQAAEARRQGDIQTAIALAQSAVEQEPTDPAALSFLAMRLPMGMNMKMPALRFAKPSIYPPRMPCYVPILGVC